MNVLYISHLTGAISEGPNYSVPAQVMAQTKYDDVFWWNLSEAKRESWLQSGLFHGPEEFPELRIGKLPKPFDRPDIVVFECFYYKEYALLARECRRKGIPYVIVPRSAFTRQGQSRHALKKLAGNALLFRRFAKRASAIHYLTDREYRDSGNKWNSRSFVIPNGFDIPPEPPAKPKRDAYLRGAYIGRFEPYQKGLDLLYDACIRIKGFLEEQRVVISLYGPERAGFKAKAAAIVEANGLGDILRIDEREGIFGEEKSEVLRSADFFILTSRFEGLPMSMLEALCYRLPCVATGGTNMAELVERYRAGITCDATAESIAAALKELCEKRAELEEMSQNALKLARLFDWSAIAGRCHAEYESIARSRRRDGRSPGGTPDGP